MQMQMITVHLLLAAQLETFKITESSPSADQR